MRLARTMRSALVIGAALAAAVAWPEAQESRPAGPNPGSTRVLLDRVVAVVNNSAILASDVDLAMRLSVLEPRRRDETPDPRNTLSRLISRNLILQQIRHDEVEASAPTADQVQDRIAEMRKQLPACMQLKCETEEGWNSFLAANHLTMSEVESYTRLRIELLAFIETRFRQGVRISQEEIESYYNTTLLPQYPKGQTAPTLESVSKRIEEILLQDQVSKLFGAWLENLRKQGDVQILDPALEMPANQSGGQGGGDA